MAGYLGIGFIALALTYMATPGVRWLATHVGAIDYPSDRKVHAQPTPTLGGLALFLGVLGAGAIAAFTPTFQGVFTQSSELLGIAAGAAIIFFLGAVDDLRDLPAPVKLAGQVFAAGIMFLAGVKWQFLVLPDQTIFLSDDVSVLVTVAWIVAMVNAVNLVDGLDGLAAGIVAIAAAGFFVYTYQLGDSGALGQSPAAPLLCVVIIGAAMGFLRFNFHPARIFMGDSGSMLLGLLLGATTVIGVGHAPSLAGAPPTAQVFLAYFPLVIPAAVLMIPLADILFAVVRRTRRRRSVFHADKQHLHHRLMDLGHGHRQAVIVMYVWSALAAGAGLAFSFLDKENVIFALPVAVGAIVLYTLFPALTKAIQKRLTL